jgi:hypothetical protein
MKRCRTIDRDEPFYYKGDLKTGLVVQTADESGYLSDAKIYISAEEITTIKRKIRKRIEIPMGSCRDNPARGSLGHIMLHNYKTSPQHLCYTIPLLVEEGFCITV